MKLKEANKTSHIAWSPSKIYPCYLACGTAAQQLDASFSTTSCLELHSLDISNHDQDLIVNASIETESRFNKLLWTNYLNNIIIGGCENGSIYLYDYESILTRNEKNALLTKLDKHTGIVAALDMNPFQPNLLASGGGSSEIFIWDLNNPTIPMTPGAKMPPLDDIQSVAWNHQVQHILASTCSGKCVVWDLRKNESIIKVNDSVSKMRAKHVYWHPDVATQLCLTSEDDHSPYIQMWDLRLATSPVKVFNGHNRGILIACWCPNDSNLLLSCGKDNRILTWNPNANPTDGEIVHEIPSSQWCFDAAWCTRNPQLVATASFESVIHVYTLMGGEFDIKPEVSNKIMDSFGVSTNITPIISQQIQNRVQKIPQLKYAPKWMRRPCGVSFGFGGKLVAFGIEQTAQLNLNEHQQTPKFQAQKINILQIATDVNLIEKSQQLENAIQMGQLIEFCSYKIEISENDLDKELWKFILGTFEKDRKTKYIDLLGFNYSNLSEKIQNIIDSNSKTDDTNVSSKVNTQLSLALNGTNLNSEKPSGLLKVNDNSSEVSRSFSPLSLSFNNQTENLLCESLLLGHYELAIDLCMSENRFADAILIATYAGPDVLKKTQESYFKMHHTKFTRLLEGFLNQDWERIINNCNIEHWKEALTAILTYTNGDKLSYYCNLLGNRIENEHKNKNDLLNACICYICSMNFDKLVICMNKIKSDDNQIDEVTIIQDSIEKIMILRHGLQNIHGDKLNTNNAENGELNTLLVKYAKLLAEQGCFLIALNYLRDANDPSLLVTKDRLYNALDYSVVQQYGIKKPENPFKSNQPSKTQSQDRVQVKNSPLKSQPVYSHPFPINQMSSQPLMNTNTMIPQLPTPAYNQIPPTTSQTNIYSTQQNLGYFNQNITQTSTNLQKQTTQATNLFAPSQISQPIVSENPLATQEQKKTFSYQDVKPTGAWNDPPIVQQKSKPVLIPQKDPSIDSLNLYQPKMPQVYAPPTIQNNRENTNATPVSQIQNPFNGVQSTNMFNVNANVVSSVNQQRNIQTPVQIPKSKSPLPSEYAIIQTTFDDLLKKCMDSSNTPIIKRKLEDVAKKLEVLYDKLREKTLSDSVIQGLYAIVQCIQSYDYVSSIQLHSQIVASGNFSEISAFMPGVKVLLQSCQQLNVT